MNLLICEDNEQCARLLERLLTRAGFEICKVTIVDTLAATLNHAQREHTSLIILDLKTRDSDTPASIAAIPDLDRHAPVVVLTGIVDDAPTYLRCHQAGAMAVLDKTRFLHVGHEAFLAHALFTATQNWKRLHAPTC